MIDFQNAAYLKLKPVNDSDFASMITPMFVPGEQIIQSFRGIRDGIVFTNKRIIAINVQGITGKKKDEERDQYLQSLGCSVVRYSNADVNLRFREVCEDIYNRLNEG